MPKRRSISEIKIEILEKSTEEIKPTKLMYAINVAWQPMRRYIEELKVGGLIEERIIGKEEFKKDRRTRVKYRTTNEGINIIKMQKEVRKSVD